MIVGKDYKKITYRNEGNWVRFAGGNALKHAQQHSIPPIQQAIDSERARLGNVAIRPIRNMR